MVRHDGYKLGVSDISINRKDKTVAVASKTGEAHSFEVSTGVLKDEICKPVRLPLTSITHNCDGTLIATGVMRAAQNSHAQKHTCDACMSRDTAGTQDRK